MAKLAAASYLGPTRDAWPAASLLFPPLARQALSIYGTNK